MTPAVDPHEDADASGSARLAPPVLGAHGLSVCRGARRVLHDLHFTLEPGWTAIVGPNGAGKSTLLRALAGLLPADGGEVRLDGRALAGWTPLERARRLAWLPQGGDSSGELTVRETVALGRLARLGLGGVPGPADRRAVDEALRATDCLAWEHQRLQALSGGERQRVLLARALATEAPLLLFDEPTTHLDPPHQIALVRLLRQLSRPAPGTAPVQGEPAPPRRVLTVLHDLPIALQADRIVVMDAGRLLAHGPVTEVAVRQALERVFAGAVRIDVRAGCAPRMELVLDPIPDAARPGAPVGRAGPPPNGPSEHDARRVRVQERLDRKTKPTGSLGRLEALARQIAVALGTDHPRLDRPQLLVCAADHGLAARGVSAYPTEVTRQMVANMHAGGAAVSVLARQHGLALTVVDCGVQGPAPVPAFALPEPPACGATGRVGRATAWLGPGTRDAGRGPALGTAAAARALDHGARLVRALPGNVLLLGEMGIGNTSSASLLMARLTGEPLERCVGRGTGLDDAALARKLALLREVLEVHAAARSPDDALAALGGFEIATLAGAVREAARGGRLVVVDGFITTAAVAVAAALAPAVLDQCVFAHASAESGHALWLRHLGAEPLLDLGLRLGEGSGAALAWPLLVSACRLLDEMASFESAGVSDRPAASHG